MIPTREEIDRIACIPQKDEAGMINYDWRRARLGCFSSSEISDLMVLGPEEKAYRRLLETGTIKLSRAEMKILQQQNPDLSEDDIMAQEFNKQLVAARSDYEAHPFGGTTMSYLFKVASERNLRKVFIKEDGLFEEFLLRTDISNRDMKWGNEMEPYAREDYQKKTGNEVTEVGFVRSASVDWLGDSPDGLVLNKKSGKPIGCIEIKCPQSKTWMMYRYTFEKGLNDGQTAAEILKDLKPEYYWQCQCHCKVNNLRWCDFIFYDRMQEGTTYIVRIYRDNRDIAEMVKRVRLANKIIDKEILKTNKTQN